MPLYQIQDDDRPGFVYAKSMADAIAKWEDAVRSENDGELGEPCNGVTYICDDSDLILSHGWEK